jgi:hypothetical protein
MPILTCLNHLYLNLLQELENLFDCVQSHQLYSIWKGNLMLKVIRGKTID